MRLKILEWNIWYKESIYNTKAIIDFINEVDADIVCLQELNSMIGMSDTIQTICDNFAYSYFALADKLPDGRTQGNGIFSKYPITNKSSILVNTPTDNSNYSKEGRSYAEAVISLGDKKKVTVGTTHLSYTASFAETAEKDLEFQKLLDAIYFNQNNFILAADLNALEGSKYIKKISEIFDLCIDINEKDWTTKPFSYQGFEVNSLKYRLDYIFKSHDIKLISSKVIPTDLSDHLPTLVEVEIN